MPDLPVRRPTLQAPSHPGDLMREILADHVKLSISAAARRMGISRRSLNAIIAGRAACTAEMALRFARLVGGAPELYISMQSQRDLWLAEHRLGATLTEIEPASINRLEVTVRDAVEPSAEARLTIAELIVRDALSAEELRRRLTVAERNHPVPALRRPEDISASRRTRGRVPGAAAEPRQGTGRRTRAE